MGKDRKQCKKEPNWLDLAERLPASLVAKLLTFFVSNEDVWMDEPDTVMKLVRIAVEDCMLCASLDASAKLHLTLYDAGAKRLHRETDPFVKFLDYTFEEVGPNEKIAKVLEKWAKAFSGSEKSKE